MRPTIYKVAKCGEGFLAVMAKPVAGEWIVDEFAGIAQFDVKCMVSLLERHEISELGLSKAPTLCESNGIEYIHFPIKDRDIPLSATKTFAMVDEIHDGILHGKNTVIHCRAGIGRTGLISASILVREGFSPVEAFKLVSQARGVPVPDTPEQFDWVVKNEKSLRAK
ncbi:MAG: dual specificity protein phosphatase family protein [Burkholderiaceae bacterium]|nr:dual specificity protein phosphatase family protein [Burkholderiaceae bacterium]